MHIYTMTIIEENNSEYRSELKLWENADGKVWIQVGYDDDPCTTQGIPLTKDDAHALINELSRILKGMEASEPEGKKETDKGIVTLTPPSPNPGTGQLTFPSKVNWGK